MIKRESLNSKLPEVSTTIFTIMTAMAQKYGAVNLAQGFPDFNPDPWLIARVNHHLHQGANQYAPMIGTEQLRKAIRLKSRHYYDVELDINNEVTVTSGATEAIFAAIQAVTKSGDEVIIFDPAYDCYDPAVQLAGGQPIHIPLRNDNFGIDWNKLKETISPKTRLIIINSPHNPTGAVLSKDDLQKLTIMIRDTNCLVLSDEVYEHMVFDGYQHVSVLQNHELRERSFVVSSFGKTFHMTGWKIGYCVAPDYLTQEFRKIHQYVTFSTTTPLQLAIADMIEHDLDYPSRIADMYQSKRNCFIQAIQSSRFRALPSRGTYFQLLDYSAISDLDDMSFTEWLTKEHGIATIPLSPFSLPTNRDFRLIRCCFAKSEETLRSVGKKLSYL